MGRKKKVTNEALKITIGDITHLFTLEELKQRNVRKEFEEIRKMIQMHKHKQQEEAKFEDFLNPASQICVQQLSPLFHQMDIELPPLLPLQQTQEASSPAQQKETHFSLINNSKDSSGRSK